MATAAELKRSIDLNLDIVDFEIEDVSELAPVWDDEPDDIRAAEELTWNSTMSRLRLDLDPAYRSGQMTPEQAERYRRLLERLAELLPVIERMGFARPPVPLEP